MRSATAHFATQGEVGARGGGRGGGGGGRFLSVMSKHEETARKHYPSR